MIIDGAPDDGSVTLRLHERKGSKFFTRHNGKFHFKIDGVFISYRRKVYNISTRSTEWYNNSTVGRHKSKTNIKFCDIFVSNEELSFYALQNVYFIEGLTVKKAIPYGVDTAIKLDVEDLFSNRPSTIKTISVWDGKNARAIELCESGRYTTGTVDTR